MDFPIAEFRLPIEREKLSLGPISQTFWSVIAGQMIVPDYSRFS